MRVADFWNLRRRISGTKLRKDRRDGNREAYLPGQTSKLGGLDDKYMFNDTGGL